MRLSGVSLTHPLPPPVLRLWSSCFEVFPEELFGKTRSLFSAFGDMLFWAHVCIPLCRQRSVCSPALGVCWFTVVFVNSNLVCSVQSFLRRQQWRRLLLGSGGEDPASRPPSTDLGPGFLERVSSIFASAYMHLPICPCSGLPFPTLLGPCYGIFTLLRFFPSAEFLGQALGALCWNLFMQAISSLQSFGTVYFCSGPLGRRRLIFKELPFQRSPCACWCFSLPSISQSFSGVLFSVCGSPLCVLQQLVATFSFLLLRFPSSS